MRPARDPDPPAERGARGLLLRALNRLDRWVERHEDYRPIGEGGHILLLKIARYRRSRLVLADGTIVNPGDRVGELHLDNRRAAALHREGHSGFRFRQEMLRMMPALALDLHTRPEYGDVHAVGAATLFARSTGLAVRLGFELRPLPPFTRWWLGTWERILLAAYHPEGQRRLARVRQDKLQQIWITRRVLRRFIGPAVEDENAGAAVPRA